MFVPGSSMTIGANGYKAFMGILLGWFYRWDRLECALDNL